MQTGKSTQSERGGGRRWGDEVPRGQEVHKEKEGIANWVKKVQASLLLPLMQREERPFKWGSNCRWGRNKVFEGTTGPGRCQCRPADGLFINCSTVHTVINYCK